MQTFLHVNNIERRVCFRQYLLLQKDILFDAVQKPLHFVCSWEEKTSFLAFLWRLFPPLAWLHFVSFYPFDIRHSVVFSPSFNPQTAPLLNHLVSPVPFSVFGMRGEGTFMKPNLIWPSRLSPLSQSVEWKRAKNTHSPYDCVSPLTKKRTRPVYLGPLAPAQVAWSNQMTYPASSASFFCFVLSRISSAPSFPFRRLQTQT